MHYEVANRLAACFSCTLVMTLFAMSMAIPVMHASSTGRLAICAADGCASSLQTTVSLQTIQPV